MKYESPLARVVQVRLEKNFADTVIVSSGIYLFDWEDGEELGDEFEDGGDIALMF